MARTLPLGATKASGQLITGALWNAGPWALTNFTTAPPIFRGRQATSQSLVSGSWTALNLDVTDVDSEGGHSNVTNNSRYTSQVTGWYWVEGYFATQTAGAISRYESVLAKNGGFVTGSPEFSVLFANDLFSIIASGMVRLVSGDYVEIWGRQTVGATLSTFVGTDLDCCLNVFWVSS